MRASLSAKYRLIRWRVGRVAARIAAVLLGLVMAEVALHALAAVTPIGAHLSGLKPRYISDPVLGVRGDSTLVEYDDWGFRNAARPRRAAVVAIGDSQTEGNGVARDHTWPQRLASLAPVDVYQLAFGGYGPPQYSVLADLALTLRPELIIVGLYTGNDIADAYRWAYTGESTAPFVARDGSARARVAAVERARGSLENTWRETQNASKDRTDSPVRLWLQRNVEKRSKLVALFKLASFRMTRARESELDREPAEWRKVSSVARKASADLLFPFEDGALRTVLTPLARLTAQDTKDPRIREGLKISLDFIRSIQERVTGHAAFAVLLIPTKEFLFAERVRAHSSTVPRALERLVTLEADLRMEVKQALLTSGIACIDPLPELRTLLAMNQNPYFQDWDGHPNAAGHSAIARAVLEWLGDRRVGSLRVTSRDELDP